MIPVGARNIRVEEVAAANNYLALMDNRGEYILNGNWYIQWSGDYEVAGTTVSYERVDNKERVIAQGPLQEPLHVMVCKLKVILKYGITNSRRLASQHIESIAKAFSSVLNVYQKRTRCRHCIPFGYLAIANIYGIYYIYLITTIYHWSVTNLLHDDVTSCLLL